MIAAGRRYPTQEVDQVAEGKPDWYRWVDIPGLDRMPPGRTDMVGTYFLAGHPFPRTFAMVWIDGEEPNTWFIIKIQVHWDYRGQGLASQILKRITSAADSQGVILKLTVEPYGDAGLDADQLSDWYLRAGFAFDPKFPGYLMRRYPTQEVRSGDR